MPLPSIGNHPFTRIASGPHNAGSVGFATDDDGNVINAIQRNPQMIGGGKSHTIDIGF